MTSEANRIRQRHERRNDFMQYTMRLIKAHDNLEDDLDHLQKDLAFTLDDLRMAQARAKEHLALLARAHTVLSAIRGDGHAVLLEDIESVLSDKAPVLQDD